MLIYTDSRCLEYQERGHPEAPFRVENTAAVLRERHGEWDWPQFEAAEEASLVRVHTAKHLTRLQEARRFDADTPYYDGIYELARLGSGAALAACRSALSGSKAFSLMRPPGHHAEKEQAMGFCYLNHAAICVQEALAESSLRVAVWDFDAHHGNGTEALLRGVPGALYVSVHQHPCYPGTGAVSVENCLNFPVAPDTKPDKHMESLRRSWEALLDFDPELVLVSAGFDAYEGDPLTHMKLREKDFRELGRWLSEAKLPTAALLEGGYSDDLPQLVEAFLEGWEQ